MDLRSVESVRGYQCVVVMDKAIEKAAVLIEALPYIQAFDEKFVVVKYGGSAMVNNEYEESVLRDLVFLEAVGMRPIVVHGGGKAISTRMKELGAEPKFVHGMRVTDKQTMEVVDDVLSAINAQIVVTIFKYGGKAKGLSGRCNGLISAKKHFGRVDGKKVDLGFVGSVSAIRSEYIRETAFNHGIPVIAPVAVGEDGEPYNINADTVAGEIAAALRAEKLIMMTDVRGILKDPKDEGTLISTLPFRNVEKLIRSGVIEGGMIPKVRSCLRALEAGVAKTHIIDARILHSLLLEIFTDTGIGTEIVR